MTHLTCRLTAKHRDQLRNPTLGNRVWATFFKVWCTFLAHPVRAVKIQQNTPSVFINRFCCLSRFIAGQQLTTFNHQSKIFVGGKIDSAGKLVRAFRGSLAGLAVCAHSFRIFPL